MKSASDQFINKLLPRWFYAGLALAFALGTAFFVFWQNSRVAVLWDLGYLLDTSWRIALGNLPYKDFPLVHAPLTFLTQAILIKLLGRHYLTTVIYAAAIGGVGTLIAWRTLVQILKARLLFAGIVALFLTAPLIFVGIYGVYPHPIYDCDCGFWILIAVWLLINLEGRAKIGWLRALLTGAAIVLPIFFKQNMGLPFAGIVAIGLLAACINSFLHREPQSLPAPPTPPSMQTMRIFQNPLARVLIGMIAATIIAIAAIQSTVGVANYLHWTVGFAAARRMPGLSLMATSYREPILLWALPAILAGWALLATPLARRLWAQILAVSCFAAPFLWTLALFFINDNADDRADSLLALWPLLLIVAALAALLDLRNGLTLRRLIPFFLLAAIHGSFMSQQLWGSTYGIWPLLMLLIAGWASLLPGPQWIRPLIASTIAAILLFCGAFYAVSLERLDYVSRPDTPAIHATLPALMPMATPGPYIQNFQALVDFSSLQIPTNDAIMLLPGEDPFYFATGRKPAMPVLLMDPATDPYSPQQLIAEARSKNVQWVIVKTDLQSLENPMPQKDETLRLVNQDFAVYQQLNGYQVFKRK